MKADRQISMEVPASTLIPPSNFVFKSLLALLSNSKSDTHIDDKILHSNWKWNWEAIDFKTSAVKCPKSLTTLLGRRFSAFNPSDNSSPRNFDNNNDEHGNVAHASLSLAAQQNILEDGELEEGQVCGEMQMQMLVEDEKEENLSSDSKEAATASQAEGCGYGYGYGYDYGIMQRNSAFFLNEAPIHKISQAKNKKKAKNQRRKQQRQKKAKQSAQPQGQEREKEGDFTTKFKALECVYKQTPQPRPKQDGPNEESRTAKKNGEITLSSFFEGEIGLWTTQTADEVLRDTKADEGDDKKAKRGPLTAERKLKKKIVKKKKKALKDKQLGIKRLKLTPVTKPKPVILCKFYMKGRCAQGEECPFSHDAVPITKSEICKYYVNHCCLKGDECPFSHDLSTFPCKFYHTKGGCLDGDACRFSHKPITEKDLEKILKQNELEKQDFCEPESLQSTIQQIALNSLQTSDVQSAFSGGDQFVNFNPVELSKPSLENNKQMSEEKRASSAILNSGKATFDECLGTTIAKEQQMPRQNGGSSPVSGIASFLENKRFDYHQRAEVENDGFLAARKAALNALAPVADHEANMVSLGLVRVPTFISSAYAAADRVVNANYLGSCGTGREHKEAQEKCDSLRVGNEKTPPTGLLNSSKGAMKILEEILRGNTNTDKRKMCSLLSSCKQMET